MWSPPEEDSSISAMTFRDKGWYSHMPADSPGTLFVGQIVFLKPLSENDAPYVLSQSSFLRANLFQKTGAGFYFWRVDDVRLFGYSEFKGDDEESELYASAQKETVTFEVDEVMDIIDVQPYFIAQELGDMYYKVSKITSSFCNSSFQVPD
jgi:hypothetical protein